MEIVGSFITRDKLDELLDKGGLIFFFSFLEKAILYITSIYFRQQKASLKYINLTGFFSEVDKQKKNKVRLILPDINNYYKLMIIKI